MSMGRYLCQFCYTIVYYGDRHPCFFYKDDEEVYTVPPPNEHDEMEERGEKSNETHGDNCYDNNGTVCSAAERNNSAGPNEANSLLSSNHGLISLKPPSRMKRGPSSLLPSDYHRRRKSRLSISKSRSSNTKESDGSKDFAKKFENPTQMVNAYNDVLPMEGPWSAEPVTSSAASGSDAAAASVAGPSGTRGKTHETGEGKPFQCDVCDKAYARRVYLEVHYRTHTGDRPFPCPECHKSFSRKDYLTTHLRIHTGEKPYKCKFCGRGFAQSSTCNTHETRTHGKK